MDYFVQAALIVGLAMLVWDCIEIGRNDAANLVNAVFGSRVLDRRRAVFLAGIAVVAGATLSSDVVDTARKGLFDTELLNIHQACAIYISVYIVDTVLLYVCSAYGVPVSTTQSLVCALAGAAVGVTLQMNAVEWGMMGEIFSAIIFSIILTGIAGFLLQRAFRGAIRGNAQDHAIVQLHGPWIAGLMITWLGWFMVMKGMKNIDWVKANLAHYGEGAQLFPSLLIVWGVLTFFLVVLLRILGRKGTTYLFHATAIIGMMCMAFAFGQNDLANGAAPGLGIYWLWTHQDLSVAEASKVEIPAWALFICGTFLVIGMTTKNAQRVTRAEVNTGSQSDHVVLWAPQWCIALARMFVRERGEVVDIAPPPAVNAAGKKLHYDTLRASVIMSISASTIAFASSMGYPVSTTYVAFAAVVATGWGDRVFDRGQADLKLGRALWVVTAWFLTAFIAFLAAIVVAWLIHELGLLGVALGLAANLSTRWYFKRRADAHEQKYHPKSETA